MPRIEFRTSVWLKLQAQRKADKNFCGNLSKYITSLIRFDVKSHIPIQRVKTIKRVNKRVD